MKKKKVAKTNLQKNHNSQLDSKKYFSDHIVELRGRLLWCVCSVVAGSIIGYYFRDRLLLYLLKPLNKTLYYTSPAGGLEFILKLSISFGIIVSVPIIIYHIYRFIQPVLSNPRRINLLKLFISSFLLIAIGLFVAYVLVLPAALHFLDEFSSDKIQSLPVAQEYLSFIISYLVVFVILFQLPVILISLNSLHRLNTNTLFKQQKYVIVLSFIIAAILTPTPDIINQIIMAVPLIILYELSVIVIWIQNKGSV